MADATLSSKIVASLRHYADRSDPTQLRWSPQDLLTQAADEIERLDAELNLTHNEARALRGAFDTSIAVQARLRAALIEVKNRTACNHCNYEDACCPRCIARKALEASPDEPKCEHGLVAPCPYCLR